MRQRYCLVLGLSLIALSALPSSAQEPRNSRVVGKSLTPSPAAQERLDEVFYRWQAYELDLPALHRKARQKGRFQLQVGGRVFDLELQPNDVRTPEYREVYYTPNGEVRPPRSEVATYKGQVAGDPDSVVRLLILPGLLQGYIKTGDEWVFIDPLMKYVRGVPASRVVVFEEHDVRPESGQLCGTGELHHMDSRLRTFEEKSKQDGLGVVTSAISYRRIDLATEADWEYYTIFGANTNAQIQNVINQIDGIYKSQLSVTLRIVFQSVYTANIDPYTVTNSNALLDQFRNHWNANRGGIARDAAHLFTGRDLDGTIVGLAWRGVVCNNPGFAYGLSQNFSNMVTLVAHEIGHNFGAFHDDEVNPPGDACLGSGTIMCSFIQNGSTTFSSRSRNDIRNHVTGNGACLEWVSLPPYEPNAHFLWSHNGPTVYFDASSSYDSDGYITHYFWDFGDGGPGGSGVSPTYTYPVEGCYTVTLTVLDNQGLIHSYSTVVAGTYRESQCI